MTMITNSNGCIMDDKIEYPEHIRDILLRGKEHGLKYSFSGLHQPTLTIMVQIPAVAHEMIIHDTNRRTVEAAIDYMIKEYC